MGQDVFLSGSPTRRTRGLRALSFLDGWTNIFSWKAFGDVSRAAPDVGFHAEAVGLYHGGVWGLKVGFEMSPVRCLCCCSCCFSLMFLSLQLWWINFGPKLFSSTIELREVFQCAPVLVPLTKAMCPPKCFFSKYLLWILF